MCYCCLLLCKLICCSLQPQSFAPGRGADRGLVGNSKCDGCRRQPPLLISPAAVERRRRSSPRVHLRSGGAWPPCQSTPCHSCNRPTSCAHVYAHIRAQTHTCTCVRCSCADFFLLRDNHTLSIAAGSAQVTKIISCAANLLKLCFS